MTHNPFQAFIQLTLFDRDIRKKEKLISSLEREVQVAEYERAELDNKLDLSKKNVHDAQKSVDGKELEMKELDVKESAEKEKFDKVTNQREYLSIKKEIEQINTVQLENESELMAAWNKLESSKVVFEKQQESHGVDVQECDEKIVEIKNKLKVAREELQSKLAGRPEVEKRVPEELLEKYVAIQKKTDTPVVPVENGCCSACFYNVPHNDIMALQRNKLLQCKDCYRFLYIENSLES